VGWPEHNYMGPRSMGLDPPHRGVLLRVRALEEEYSFQLSGMEKEISWGK
ncbi:uncharacterized, partial [Tachysurus ichikawai]